MLLDSTLLELHELSRCLSASPSDPESISSSHPSIDLEHGTISLTIASCTGPILDWMASDQVWNLIGPFLAPMDEE